MSRRRLIEVDRISNLPGNIIDQILMRLPMKDAAKTCVLSRNWMYKWAELPYLTISDRDFPSASHDMIVAMVDHILLLHLGPIPKFKLEIAAYEFYKYEAALDRWIIHLSRNHTKEFELKFDTSESEVEYEVPYCFFSWQSLTNLVCHGFPLRLPSLFTGFINLKSLELHYMDIDKDDFENLISRCPVLERLTLDWNVYRYSHVKINAPNLQFLHLNINCEGVSFENTRCLAEVSLHYYGIEDFILKQDSSVFSNFFDQLSMVRKLHICFNFLEYMTFGVDPGKLSISYTSLEDLEVEVDINRRGHFSSALCLLKISPNLTKLSMMTFELGTHEKAYFWEDDHCNCTFSKLQYMEITDLSRYGTRHVLGFIKFILSNSPVLKKMVIKSNNLHCHFLRDLLSMRRASVLAQIICSNL